MKYCLSALMMITLICSSSTCAKEEFILPELVNTWRHSIEEDTANTRVWRPEDYHQQWPVARGREFFTLEASGKAAYYTIAPNDAGHVAKEGKWKVRDGQLVFSFEDGTEKSYPLKAYSRDKIVFGD